MGVAIPRDADLQCRDGMAWKASRRQATCYFSAKQGWGWRMRGMTHVTHVAISLGGTDFIHASGSSMGITYNSLDPQSPIYQCLFEGKSAGSAEVPMRLSWEPVTLNLRTTFRIAHGASDQRHNVIVRLEEGVGEAAAVPFYGDTQASLMEYLAGVGDALGDDPFWIDEDPGAQTSRAARQPGRRSILLCTTCGENAWASRFTGCLVLTRNGCRRPPLRLPWMSQK